ncbi:MAG: hypothetical protein QNI89_04285 [Desulfobacterales bacterium]|nr:hypothetical protein [Desulfobacterales bacterium]MDJ0886493.1 hypothetical protein [Desulfobacterales bacterium]
MNFIKNHLILMVGLLGTLVFFATLPLDLSRDSTGIEGVLFWISRLAGMIVIIPNQLLILFNDGEMIPFHRTLSIGIGLGGCMVLDVIKNKLRRQ